MVGGIDRDRMLAEDLRSADGEAHAGDGHAAAGPGLRNTVLDAAALLKQRHREGAGSAGRGPGEEGRGLKDVAAPANEAWERVGARVHTGTPARARRSGRASPTR